MAGALHARLGEPRIQLDANGAPQAAVSRLPHGHAARGSSFGRRMPEIPELEGGHSWAAVPVDFTWDAHLHRKYRPFTGAILKSYEAGAASVRLTYGVLVGDGRFSKYFVDRHKVNVNAMDLCFAYPYQWSDTGGRIKHWCFFLPMNERRTRAFFIFYFDAFRVPFTRLSIPAWLMRPLLRVARRVMIRPLLAQDGGMVAAEQEAYERDPRAPSIELNPVVLAFQDLIVAKWRQHLGAPELGAPDNADAAVLERSHG